MPAAAAFFDSKVPGTVHKIVNALEMPMEASARQATAGNGLFMNSVVSESPNAPTQAVIAKCHRRSPWRSEWPPMMIIAEMPAKAGTTDVPAVRQALAGLKADTIYGNVEMRAADHQLVRQMLMAQVVKGEDGKPAFAIRSVYPGASNTPAPSPDCRL